MDDHEAFLLRHRGRLLAYLDGQAPAGAGEPDALSYVDLVLDEWGEHFATRVLPAPTLEERTFWFALYQLEDLVEFPARGAPDPYEGVMLGVLAQARELLRGWRPLPLGFMATRPDGS
jgi:hypothetical protein